MLSNDFKINKVDKYIYIKNTNKGYVMLENNINNILEPHLIN